MACKYPIVLVHGLMIRHFKRNRAFGRIGAALCDDGHSVHIATHDAFGSIETNAAQIKVFVLEVLAKTGADKVNVIAHSKGGLDVEYAITKLGLGDRIASLTTLSTPHKGSLLASLVWRFPRWMRCVAAFFINGFYKMLGDRQPDALRACFQLRTRRESYPSEIREGILCQSFSSRMKRSRDHFLLSVPHAIYKIVGKEESDGMVTPESARFAEYRGDAFDFSVSHGEIVDFMSTKKKRVAVISFYKKLVTELEKCKK